MSHEITEDRLRRFRAKCTPAVGSDCILWTGGTNEHGYGVFWNGQKLEKAHRFSLRASGAEVGPEDDVRHSCDNPACVNPKHLSAGTTTANVRDMWARGRARTPRTVGESQHCAKLSGEKVDQMRAQYARGGVTQRELARQFGVSQAAVWRVVSGDGWKAASGFEIVVHEARA